MNKQQHEMTWVIAQHPWGEAVNGWAYKWDKKYDVLMFDTEEEAVKAMTDEDRESSSVALHVIKSLIND
tara:strand:- start:851 stop:1057 length:207 start_codon:yes stop_codon:yes gene_type:complete